MAPLPPSSSSWPCCCSGGLSWAAGGMWLPSWPRCRTSPPRTPWTPTRTPPWVRIASHSTLQDAAHATRAANVSSVLIDPDTSMVTERDLTRALNAGIGPQASVAGVSVTDLVSVDQDTTVFEAADEMLRHEITHLLDATT